MKCLSCGKDFVQGTSFKCPECKKEMIMRCIKCKRLNISYKCKCGSIGP